MANVLKLHCAYTHYPTERGLVPRYNNRLSASDFRSRAVSSSFGAAAAVINGPSGRFARGTSQSDVCRRDRTCTTTMKQSFVVGGMLALLLVVGMFRCTVCLQNGKYLCYIYICTI